METIEWDANVLDAVCEKSNWLYKHIRNIYVPVRAVLGFHFLVD